MSDNSKVNLNTEQDNLKVSAEELEQKIFIAETKAQAGSFLKLVGYQFRITELEHCLAEVKTTIERRLNGDAAVGARFDEDLSEAVKMIELTHGTADYKR